MTTDVYEWADAYSAVSEKILVLVQDLLDTAETTDRPAHAAYLDAANRLITLHTTVLNARPR